MVWDQFHGFRPQVAQILRLPPSSRAVPLPVTVRRARLAVETRRTFSTAHMINGYALNCERERALLVAESGGGYRNEKPVCTAPGAVRMLRCRRVFDSRSQGQSHTLPSIVANGRVEKTAPVLPAEKSLALVRFVHPSHVPCFVNRLSESAARLLPMGLAASSGIAVPAVARSRLSDQ